jgi:hypothetical protein
MFHAFGVFFSGVGPQRDLHSQPKATPWEIKPYAKSPERLNRDRIRVAFIWAINR